MSVGGRLKQLRKNSGITQHELASRLYLATSSIGMYERDERTPSPEVLKKYADIFDVSLDYILGNSKELKEGEDYRTIKVYGQVPAGIPIEAVEDISDTEDISFKDFDRNKEYIGLKVTGDSMYPKYLDGDTIIIEVTPDFYSGQDCVVYVNGYDATLKTVIKNNDDTITLKPINPTYAPRTYGKNDDPIRIIGIVREIRRKI